MTITQPQAAAGLSAAAASASSRTLGTVFIGSPETRINLPLATAAYALSAKLAESGNTLSLDVQHGEASGTTATASTLVLGSGNSQLTFSSTALGLDANAITITITAADGVTIPTVTTAGFAVTIIVGSTTTANQVVTALAAVPFVGAVAGGTGAGVVAAVSATPMTGATGTVILGGTGADFEGHALPSLASIDGLSISVLSGAASASNGTHTFPLPATFGLPAGLAGALLTADLVITATADNTEVAVTV